MIDVWLEFAVCIHDEMVYVAREMARRSESCPLYDTGRKVRLAVDAVSWGLASYPLEVRIALAPDVDARDTCLSILDMEESWPDLEGFRPFSDMVRSGIIMIEKEHPAIGNPIYT